MAIKSQIASKSLPQCRQKLRVIMSDGSNVTSESTTVAVKRLCQEITEETNPVKLQALLTHVDALIDDLRNALAKALQRHEICGRDATLRHLNVN